MNWRAFCIVWSIDRVVGSWINRGLPAKLSVESTLVVVQSSFGVESSGSVPVVVSIVWPSPDDRGLPAKLPFICIYHAVAYLWEPCVDCSTVTGKFEVDISE